MKTISLEPMLLYTSYGSCVYPGSMTVSPDMVRHLIVDVFLYRMIAELGITSFLEWLDT